MTNTGHLTVGAGYNLTVQGDLLNAGILEIAGTFTVQGNYTQAVGAALDIDIASPTVYGTLTVSGTATLAGTLNVALQGGYMPALGTSFTILTFGGAAGGLQHRERPHVQPERVVRRQLLGEHADAGGHTVKVSREAESSERSAGQRPRPRSAQKTAPPG